VSCSESVKQQTDGRTTRREGRHPLLKSMLVRNCIDWTVHIPKTSTPKTEAPIVQYRSSLAHHSTSPNHSPSPSIIPISPVPFTTIIIAHMQLTSKYSPRGQRKQIHRNIPPLSCHQGTGSRPFSEKKKGLDAV